MKTKQIEKILEKIQNNLRCASNPVYSRREREDAQIKIDELYQKLGELL